MMVERSSSSRWEVSTRAFIVAGNDVDLCLRLTGAGYRSLCVPECSPRA